MKKFYKVFIFINYTLIIIEVMFAIITIIENRNRPSFQELTKCSAKFNCSVCNNGMQECSSLSDSEDIESITCPCEGGYNE